MYYSEKTGIWERKVTPSSLSQCEQLPTNDDELGDNECVNLDDDEPFVVNDLTDSDQETSKLDSDIDDHMNTWWVGSEGCDTRTPGGWGVRDVIQGHLVGGE